jgi:hypothetical protein
MIDEARQRRLEAQGWQVGSADDFLGLSAEESAYVDLRLRLSDPLRAQRQRQPDPSRHPPTEPGPRDWLWSRRWVGL